MPAALKMADTYKMGHALLYRADPMTYPMNRGFQVGPRHLVNDPTP